MTVEVDLTALHTLWGKTPHNPSNLRSDGLERSGRHNITSRTKYAQEAQEFVQSDLFQNECPWEDCPWENEPAHTAYQKRIHQCFADAYKFMDENKHVRNGEGWGRVTGRLAQYKDPLTIDLVLAAMKELEREYQLTHRLEKGACTQA